MSGSKARKKRICWDSCVFLAHFNNEVDKPLAKIRSLVRDIEMNRLELINPAVCFVEVLSDATEHDGQTYEQFTLRDNVETANIDRRLGKLAKSIRSAGLLEFKAGRLTQGIKIPDALVLAAAIQYEAAELHTFDPVLLQADGLPLAQGVRIIEPNHSQFLDPQQDFIDNQ